MRCLIAFAVSLSACTWVAAQEPKSAEECAAEVGDATGSEREKRMVECLLSHSPGALEPWRDPDEKRPYFVKYLTHSVNSAGGVELEIGLVNPGHASAIKYITLDLRMFNAVGDVITDRISRSSTGTVRYTGPLRAEDGVDDTSWKPLWYNGNAACIRIESVHVQFMNGKSLRFQGGTLRNALSQRITNSCRPTAR